MKPAKEKMERRIPTWMVLLAACLLPFMWISATDATFDCPDIDNAVVHHMPIQLPPTVVPATKSARKCTDLHFRPPVNTSYLDHRLIAFKSTAPPPSDLVNRMLLYGCEGEREDVLTHDCVDPKAGMGQCQVIGSWSPGSLGDCFHLNSGIPFGKKGFASLTLEVRWSNPALVKDKVDSPGMLLYFTPQLRQYDSSTLKLGNDYVEIPPHSPASSVTSSCTSACTRAILQQDVYVTSVISLMNELGTRQSVELHREGKLLLNLMNVALTPDKRSPARLTQVKYHDPIQVKPGDVITTTCHYSSTNTNVTTFNTNGALYKDETCYAYLRFYPAHAASSLRPSCVSWKTVLPCSSDSESGCTQKQREQFHHGNLPNTGFYKSIIGKCPVFGVCTRECKLAVLEATVQEPCMANEEHWLQIKTTMLALDQFGRQFLSAMASCELDIFKDSLVKTEIQKEPAETVANGSAAIQPKDEKMTTKPKRKAVVMRRKYVCSGARKTSIYMLVLLMCLFVILDITAA